MGVNKVILVGNLGKDPELRYTPQHYPICSFSLATGERRKDQSGNWADHTEWHNIVVFGKTAEHCSNYLKKGRQVYIEGKIQTRKWQDREGKDRYTTEILANTVQFLGAKGGDMPRGAEQGSYSPQAEEAPSSIETAESPDANIGFDDDDIPF